MVRAGGTCAVYRYCIPYSGSVDARVSGWVLYISTLVPCIESSLSRGMTQACVYQRSAR